MGIYEMGSATDSGAVGERNMGGLDSARKAAEDARFGWDRGREDNRTWTLGIRYNEYRSIGPAGCSGGLTTGNRQEIGSCRRTEDRLRSRTGTR